MHPRYKRARRKARVDAANPTMRYTNAARPPYEPAHVIMVIDHNGDELMTATTCASSTRATKEITTNGAAKPSTECVTTITDSQVTSRNYLLVRLSPFDFKNLKNTPQLPHVYIVWTL